MATTNPAERYPVDVRRDVRIPTAEPGVTLSADLYLPVGPVRMPALVTVIPYRKDMFAGRGYDRPLRWFAARGYACLLANLRGVGSSDGVQRPRLDPGEGDDGVAVIEWAAAQPWCTGSVGMWGISYGGALTMRTASRRPPALKAIIPLSCSLDPERYQGARGDLGLLAQWGGQMLLEQLLPPLAEHTSTRQRRRWRDRLRDTEPVAVETARHQPGDAAWRARVIDPRLIAVPALCVGGWQDAFPDEVTGYYERLAGPKKLLMGPWVHTMPQDSPFDAIDFLPIALRWWDHWLRDEHNGVLDEPAVCLYTLGSRPGWRGYKAWPPATGDDALLRTGNSTGAGTRLVASECADPVDSGVLAEYRSDPTIGALSGLGGETGGMGLPLDQHEDDCRAIATTGDPLTADLHICGRPTVAVRLAGNAGPGDPVAPRLIVRLTTVDPHGRSFLISKGRLATHGRSGTHRVTLRPTSYRVPAGHRLRVVLSDSDFPLLTPLPERYLIRLAGLALSVPTVADAEGIPVDIPVLDRPAEPVRAGTGERWTITRDPVHDGVEVMVGSAARGFSTDGAHTLDRHTEARTAVRRATPDAVVSTGVHTMRATMSTGETITVNTHIRCTQTEFVAHGAVVVDGVTIFSSQWEVPLQPSADLLPEGGS